MIHGFFFCWELGAVSLERVIGFGCTKWSRHQMVRRQTSDCHMVVIDFCVTKRSRHQPLA